MDHRLMGKAFALHRSGVYAGEFVFQSQGLQWCAVDQETRVQLKSIPFEQHMQEPLFDFVKLSENLAEYAEAGWKTHSLRKALVRRSWSKT